MNSKYTTTFRTDSHTFAISVIVRAGLSVVDNGRSIAINYNDQLDKQIAKTALRNAGIFFRATTVVNVD